MYIQNEPKPFLYLKVSLLSHIEICCKRSKLETFGSSHGKIPYKRGSSLAQGKKLHRDYSYFLTDFDRELVRSGLNTFKVKGAFQKFIELPEVIVIVRGDYDDLRIIRQYLKEKIIKLVSFIEVKTTRKKYMWNLEVKAAIRQLQLYLWLLKELVEFLGYDLWKRHYLEIFSQNTGKLLRRIPIEYDENIEEWIKLAVYKFLGLAPMNIAPYKYCLLCPDIAKRDCPYFYVRSLK